MRLFYNSILWLCMLASVSCHEKSEEIFFHRNQNLKKNRKSLWIRILRKTNDISHYGMSPKEGGYGA